ncbi:MAG: hypothetical protein B6I19_06655 [Bacteroidetes bacterium 4572_114]|nr:MAG: hypothetical protein B6I19_06655 [Bacteroidetes bacterium 4572_114]
MGKWNSGRMEEWSNGGMWEWNSGKIGYKECTLVGNTTAAAGAVELPSLEGEAPKSFGGDGVHIAEVRKTYKNNYN